MKYTDSQNLAINSNNPAILVLAGAGSGKTSVVVARIARLLSEGVSAKSILCITFTRKAANELKERLALIVGEQKIKGMWVGTFHAISYKILMTWGEKIGYKTTGGHAITVITPDESEELLSQIIKNYNYKKTKKALFEAKNAYCHKGEITTDAELKRILQEYYKKLLESNAVDFDLLLIEVNRLFQKVPESVDYYFTLFQHIFVDEYQDTDYMQYRLHAWINPINLFCVGDINQSIYGFRGADVSIIQNFLKDNKDGEVIKLQECFRCGNAIVDKANKLISKNEKTFDLQLIGKTGKEGEVVKIPSEKLIETIVEDMAFEVAWDIAVIARKHSTLEKLHKDLSELGIDSTHVGQKTKEIESDSLFKTVLSILKLNYNPRDNIAFLTLNTCFLNADLSVVWQKANEKGCSWFEAFSGKNCFEYNLKVQIYPLVLQILEDILTPKSDSKAIVEFFSGFKMSSGDWLKYWLTKDQHFELEKRENKITLITAHGAKGLEWKNVLIADFDEDVFPSKMALKSFTGEEEERRLAYVAFTRAKESLFLFHGDKPSKFLKEI